MSKPLNPMVLYARLADASSDLSRALSFLEADHPLCHRLFAAWLALDNLIEQLPASLAWDAQQQPQDGSHD
jgi:hypothetical protein